MNKNSINLNFYNFTKSMRNFEKLNNDFSLKDIIIFFSILIVIPFIWTLIISLSVPDYSEKISNLIMSSSQEKDWPKLYSVLYNINGWIFGLIFPIIATGFLFFRDRVYFFKSCLWIFPLMIVANYLLGSIFVSIAGSIAKDDMSKSTDAKSIANIIFLLVIKVPLICFYFWRIKYNPFKTFENNVWTYLKIVLWIVIAIGLYYLLAFSFSKLTGVWAPQKPSNQDALEKQILSIWGKVNLFISAVIIAPLFEELCYRKILFDVVDESKANRIKSINILPFVLSVLYFGYLHIQAYAEVQLILLYFPLAIVNGITYWYFKNYYYCVSIHFIINLIAWSLIIAGVEFI